MGRVGVPLEAGPGGGQAGVENPWCDGGLGHRWGTLGVGGARVCVQSGKGGGAEVCTAGGVQRLGRRGYAQRTSARLPRPTHRASCPFLPSTPTPPHPNTQGLRCRPPPPTRSGSWPCLATAAPRPGAWASPRTKASQGSRVGQGRAGQGRAGQGRERELAAFEAAPGRGRVFPPSAPACACACQGLPLPAVTRAARVPVHAARIRQRRRSSSSLVPCLSPPWPPSQATPDGTPSSLRVPQSTTSSG